MSIQNITTIFENLNNCKSCSLQLLNISSTKKEGVNYASREIGLFPSECFTNLLKEIGDTYLYSKTKALSIYQEVREYDGTTNSLTIYKMSTDDPLISDEYQKLLNAIANPNVESDPFSYTSAYLIKGTIDLEGKDIAFKMFSIQNPITTLRNKYSLNKGHFYEMHYQVLSLRPTFDIVVVDKTVYFLTMAGENLFNMSRAYKKVCQTKIDLIIQNDIVNDTGMFSTVATSGHNPRRFISFNDKGLNILKDEAKRISIATQFSIPIDINGKFDTTVDGASEKIVKLLCNKGMLEPFGNNAVEVDSAKRWA